MSRLLWSEVQYDGKLHKAAVTWSWSGRLKRMEVVALRLFTTDPTPAEVHSIPTSKIDGLIDQLVPPESN